MRCCWSWTTTTCRLRPVHESVAFLLENLPPAAIAVSGGLTRAAAGAAAARGQLAELRAAELRFTTDEAAALLGVAGVLPNTAVVALTPTEGWAAGLQLAALSLRGHADAAGFVAAFSGSHASCWTTWRMSPGRPARPVRAFLLETRCWRAVGGAV